MNTNCSQCQQKDDLIHKYLKLIKLLKTKCQKSTSTYVKKNTLPSDTLYQSSLENSDSLVSHFKSNLIQSSVNPEKLLGEEKSKCQIKLALMIITNRMRKALLKQSFCEVKEWKIPQIKSNRFQFQNQQLQLPNSIISSIEENLTQGKTLLESSLISSLKPLHKQIFHLQLQNQKLTKSLSQLQHQLNQSQKRLYKQTQKKRQSLQTFGQEIRQKTEAINELQYTIKQYQKMYGKNVACNVLDEDLQEMKTNCCRLEKINQKLNYMVKDLEGRIVTLDKHAQILKVNNCQLKEENISLKEKLFDLSHQVTQNQQFSSIYTNLIKKLNKKYESLKHTQKHLLSSIKINQLHQSVSPILINSKIVSTKNTDLSNSDSNKISLRELQAEQKVQQIFAFLFNIKEKDFRIENEDIFDQDELELLNYHKQFFLASIKEDFDASLNRQTLRKQINIDQSHFRQSDEVFYSKKTNLGHCQNSKDDSLLCALNEQKTLEKPQQNCNQMKMIQLEIQKSKLIEKISELKNLHMHIRNVVLNFMKSIDLTALRPDTGSILELVFDFFQYSEDEKAVIFQEKKKKFWGLL